MSKSVFHRLLSSPGSYRVVITLFLLSSASLLEAQPYDAPQVPLASPSIGSPAVTADSSSTGSFVFAYDAAGRLVGMADAAGNTATYTYDAVGNILSIGRGSSAVSILAFNPSSGPVGTAVTIVGSGFSTTAAQNAVTFNGVSAAVMTSTSNQLAAVVPSGATTGPIRVTCPAGSAVSSTSFTVRPNNAPSISGFTPAIGTAGSTVTITGTNFEPVTSNNKVSFDGYVGGVSSATATTLGTVVSSLATSGPISVSTPNGHAISTGDFFVPPSPYTAADVAATGRMAIGETRTVTISQPNKIGLVVFSGSAGQRISLAADLAFTGSGCGFVSILRPDGTTLANSDIECGGLAFIDAQTLPVSGTYQIVFDPLDTATGTSTLTLYNVPPDVTAAIVPGGSPVTVTTTTPGQNAVLTFAGSVGQRISLAFNVTLPGGGVTCGYVYILRPDGTALANSGLQCEPGFIDVQVLPVSGNYRVVFDPLDYFLGSATLTLYNVPPDVTATIVPGGPPVTVTTTTPGQNAVLTFAGSAGQHIFSDFNSAFTGGSICGETVSLLRPDGVVLVNSHVSCTGSDFVDLQILPISGNYQIVFNPADTATGSTTVKLEIVPSDVMAPIVPGGSPVTVTTTAPGQNAVLTFAGSAGQRISLAINVEVVGYVSILRPDGTALVDPTLCFTSVFIDLQILPVSGAYQIVFDPSSNSTGSVTVALYNVPPDVTAAIVTGGSPVMVTTTTPGQNAVLTFVGSAGQHISLSISVALTGGSNCGFVSVLRPDGTALVDSTLECGAGSIDVQVLPASGTYRILLDPAGAAIGTATLTLHIVGTAPAVTSISPRGGTTLGGTPVVLTGGNFQSGATVSIGGVSATGVTVAGNTITAITGAHATGTVSVSVTNPNTLSGTLSNGYFYDQPSGALRFYTITPCRLVDTRNPSGPLGGPSLGAGTLRTFTAIGSCGIPTEAKSLSVNVTVVGPAAVGFLALYPGNAIPMGTQNVTFSAGQTRASSAMVKLSTDGLGTFTVQNGAPGNVDVLVDVNGYFK